MGPAGTGAGLVSTLKMWRAPPLSPRCSTPGPLPGGPHVPGKAQGDRTAGAAAAAAGAGRLLHQEKLEREQQHLRTQVTGGACRGRLPLGRELSDPTSVPLGISRADRASVTVV